MGIGTVVGEPMKLTLHLQTIHDLGCLDLKFFFTSLKAMYTQQNYPLSFDIFLRL